MATSSARKVRKPAPPPSNPAMPYLVGLGIALVVIAVGFIGYKLIAGSKMSALREEIRALEEVPADKLPEIEADMSAGKMNKHLPFNYQMRLRSVLTDNSKLFKGWMYWSIGVIVVCLGFALAYVKSKA